MRPLLVFFFLLPLCAFDAGEKFLEENALYQKESYYRKQVYEEHDWKSFYKLKDANAAVDPEHYDLHLLNAAIFYSTNRLREEKGMKPLKFAPELRDAAVVHTQQMVKQKFFNHFNPRPGKLHSPEDRMKMFDVKGAELGENIDMTEYYEPRETTYVELADIIVKEFFNSPPHRKAMLSKTFTHIGCAAMFEAKSRNGINPVKTTQDFMRAR